MAVIETWLKSDLKKPIQVQKLSGNLFSGDNGGNKIGVEVFDNGSAASLSGGVTGYVIRPDNAYFTVTGTLSENKAYIVLPQAAYIAVGEISIVIKVGTTTVGACVGYVYRTTTDTLIDPSHTIPSLQDLLAQIAACQSATTAANNAASSANSAASSANTAASNANTKAQLADTKATLANTKAELADQKATAANTAAGAANTAAGKIDNMTVSISSGDPTASPTATLTLVDGHYLLAFNNMKGLKGDTGEAFHIVKTYASIAAMNADYSGTDVSIGDYVMIVSNVEDPDNAKVYIKGSSAFSFVVDMSGSTGIQGQQAFVHIRYAASQPTQDSDMKTTPDKYIGIYSGTASTAPTTYSSYTWYEFKGDKGDTGDTGSSGVYYGTETPTDPAINVWIDPSGLPGVYVTEGEVDRTRIHGSASTPAAVITLTDGADSIPMSVTAQIDPVQNLNGYDYPWAGGCGKNLAYIDHTFGSALSRGLTATKNDDGSITIKGTYTSSSNGFIGTTENAVTLPAGTYTISGTTEGWYDSYGIRFYVNSSIVGTGDFTLSEETSIPFRFQIAASKAQNVPLPSDGLTFYPMIRMSSTSADYEPYSNVCPITGFSAVNITRSGKNLWSGFIAGKYWETDGRESSKSSSLYAGTNKIKINGNVNFKLFSDTLSNGNLLAFFFDKNGVFISGSYAISDSNTTTKGTNVPVTIPEGTEYVAFRIYRSSTNGGVAAYVSAQIMLSYQEETVYEAYNGTTYAISIPSTPGTVYGGTLTVNKDGTGSLVVDRTSITLGSADQIRTSSTISTGKFVRYSAPGSNTDRTIVCAIGEKLKGVAPDIVSSVVAWDVYTYGTPSHYIAVAVPADATTTTVDDAIKDSKVVYLLETPVTYPLTASQVNAIITSLYGINNVWADTGKISVNDYSIDTKKYVDSLFSSIVNATGVSF